jgi:hypothetical protein
MNKKCTIIIDDEVNARVAGLAPQDQSSLWEKFGFFAEGYRWMPKYQLGVWDGKIRYYDKSGKTYTKLLNEIIPYIVSWNYEIDLKDNRKVVTLITDRVSENYFDKIKKYEDGEEIIRLRPYQVECVNQCLEEGSGFIIAGTGAGKTLMCAALSSVLEQNNIQTIIIVPSSDLVTQTINELEKCGLAVGEYSGDQQRPSRKNRFLSRRRYCVQEGK